MTTNHKQYQQQTNALKNSRSLNGSRSTKNIKTASFLNPKKTVSINLYSNCKENDERFSESDSEVKHMNRELIQIDQNSSRFSTLKKPIRFAEVKKSSNMNSTLKEHTNKYGMRKRTLESSSPLINLSKQLEKTEKDLVLVSRKQSQQIGSIHEKIRTLKTQLNQHKIDCSSDINQISEKNNMIKSKTPNAQSRSKAKNMAKYLQSNSRNHQSALKEAKTQEKVSGRNSYKPFKSLMVKSFSRASLNQPKESEAVNSRSKVPSYLEKAYKRAMQSLESNSSKGKRRSIGSNESDKIKADYRNLKSSQSSNILSMSEEEINEMNPLANRSRLMYIQEEQEYTTNEGIGVIMESSCRCETDEDKYDSNKQYDTNKQFVKTYCYQKLDEHHSDLDNEVLLSSPQNRVKKYQNLK